MNETGMHKLQGIIERWKNFGIRVGPKLVSPKAKRSSTKGRHGEDLEYIPELGEVVERFDDTDETNLDLEDEPVPLSIEMLVLSCM
jgi:hypothetical protein